MEGQKQSLKSILSTTVCIVGFGNQGSAQAENLRDSGVSVVIGARKDGQSWEKASKAGFKVLEISEAIKAAAIVMWLLPDQEIPKVFEKYQTDLGGKLNGFSHGFALHFGLISTDPAIRYFLAAPKGAGAILRENYLSGEGLPGAFALGPHCGEDDRDLVVSYCHGIGIGRKLLIETSFQEETECDLFGEQAVLCGGIFQLMESAFEIMVRRGFSPEMAFLECGYESLMILKLWMKFGPSELSKRISPTAFFGGSTRGPRIIDDEVRKKMEVIMDEIQSGAFAKEWLAEIDADTPKLKAERSRLKDSAIEAAYQEVKKGL